MRQDLHFMIIRGALIGGLAGGLVGGLTAAVNVYLGHFDPDIYPYRSISTVSIFFVGGFILALVPGVLSGMLIGLAVSIFSRRRSATGNTEIIQPQGVWPPAPTVEEVNANEHDV